MADYLNELQCDALLDYLNTQELPFPRYRFTEDSSTGHMCRLGSGGSGIVYEATNETDLFAVKIVGLKHRVSDSVQITAQLSEVEEQVRLSAGCPQILRIIDRQVLCIAFDPDGTPAQIRSYDPLFYDPQPEESLFLFVMMEKLQPVFIGDRILPARLEALQEQQILQYALDIGDAIRTVHEKKVAHRDIKLENTFYDPQNQRYKLGDFGLAKGADGVDSAAREGTGRYMAPEVARGTSRDFFKADIFSFGVTLYRLLNDLKPPSFGPEDSRKWISAPAHGSRALTQIVMKACSYRPEDRYSTIADMLAQLQSLQCGVPQRKAEAPQRTPALCRAEEQACRTLGRIGMVAFFLSVVVGGYLLAAAFLPPVASWQTYGALLLAIAAALRLTFAGGTEQYLPLRTPFESLWKKGFGAVALWVATIGFNLYAFAACKCWLFLLLAGVLALGCLGLVWSAAAAAVVCTALSFLYPQLQQTLRILPGAYWLVILMSLAGIRFCMLCKNGSRCALLDHPPQLHSMLFALSLCIADVALRAMERAGLLKIIPIVHQLHLFRVGLALAGLLLLELLLGDLLQHFTKDKEAAPK